MKKRKWYFNFMILCIIEVIICVGMFFAASLQKNLTQTAEMALNTVSGNIQKYVCTETLKRGSYDVTIDYSAKDDKSTYCFEADPMFDYGAVDGLLQSDVKGCFARYADSITLKIILPADTGGLTLDIVSSDAGLKISGMAVSRNSQQNYIDVLRMFLIFLLLDIILLMIFRWKIPDKIKNNRMASIGIMLLIFVSGMPLYFHGITEAYDLPIHLLRIEGLKEAIVIGQFPARIQPVQCEGYGYATSVLYPELFLYFPALLRICGLSIIASFKIFLMAVNAATVLIAFFSFRQIFKKDWAAFCGTVLYTLAPYRIGDIYYRQSVGEYLAYMAFPLIAYGMYLLIQSNEDEMPSSLPLIAGFTIVLQSHILSIIYVAAGCMTIFFVYHKKCFRKGVVLSALKSLFFTVLINLWFILPFADFFREKYNSFAGYIQGRGMTVSQLFVNFLLPTDSYSYVVGNIPYGIGMAMMFALVPFILYRRNGMRFRKAAEVSFVIGIVLSIMSTKYFPWDRLASAGGTIQKLIFNVQFPQRMLEPAAICFTIAAVAGLIWMEERYKSSGEHVVMFIVAAVCILSYIQSAALTDNAVQTQPTFNQTLMTLDNTALGTDDEYFPKGVRVETLMKRDRLVESSSAQISISDYSKAGSNMSISVRNNGGDGYIDLPMVYYKGFASKQARLSAADDGTIRVSIPAGYAGKIDVGYRESLIYQMADIISLCMLLYVISIILKNMKRLNNNEKDS